MPPSPEKCGECRKEICCESMAIDSIVHYNTTEFCHGHRAGEKGCEIRWTVVEKPTLQYSCWSCVTHQVIMLNATDEKSKPDSCLPRPKGEGKSLAERWGIEKTKRTDEELRIINECIEELRLNLKRPELAVSVLEIYRDYGPDKK